MNIYFLFLYIAMLIPSLFWSPVPSPLFLMRRRRRGIFRNGSFRLYYFFFFKSSDIYYSALSEWKRKREKRDKKYTYTESHIHPLNITEGGKGGRDRKLKDGWIRRAAKEGRKSATRKCTLIHAKRRSGGKDKGW